MEHFQASLQIKLPDPAFVVLMDRRRFSACLLKVPKIAWEPTESRLEAIIQSLAAKNFQNIDMGGTIAFLFLKDPADEQVFCFAKGIEPVNGVDGMVRFAFEPNPLDGIWDETDDKRIDFRRSQDINNVQENQLLAEIIPPTDGCNGTDVFGAPVPARRGRKVKAIAGKNAMISADGTKIHAATSGYAKKVRTTISVDKRRIVQGDVDFHTGNIQYNGDVLIMGDIRETFSVTAMGSVIVRGTVDRASIQAGGHITVQGGVYGKYEVSLQAEGNIMLCFAENATIRCSGSLYVRSYLMNCRAESSEFIHLGGAEKSLIGGHIRAAHGVIADSLGNPGMPTETIVEFGLTQQTDAMARSLTLEFRRASEERRAQIQDQLEGIRDEYEKQLRARVIARNVTYPGVIVRAGKASYTVRTEINRMVYSKIRDRHEIAMRAFMDKDLR